METVRYVINGANQIECVDDVSADKHCDDGETLWNYDKYGNLKSDGTNTYVYDAANRLSSITNAAGTTTYTYNGDGDRISQSVNGTLTTYILDTATPLTMLLSESTGGKTTRYWHGLDTLAQSDGTSVETFAYDGLGSVRQLVGESGSVGLAQTFDPYGNGFSKAGSAGSSFGYSGEQTDSNGFIFLRARYYNPAQGRFFQMDPSRQERNAYLYVGSNPIRFVDPSGLQQTPCDPSDWVCLLSGLIFIPPEIGTGAPPIEIGIPETGPGNYPVEPWRLPEYPQFPDKIPGKLPTTAPAAIPCWVLPNIFIWIGIPLLLCGDTPLGCGTGPKPDDEPKPGPDPGPKPGGGDGPWPVPYPTPTPDPYFDLAFGRSETLAGFASQFHNPEAYHFEIFQHIAWMMTAPNGERLFMGGNDGEKIFYATTIAISQWHYQYPQGKIKFNLNGLDRALDPAGSFYPYQPGDDSIDILTLSELRYILGTNYLLRVTDFYDYNGFTNQLLVGPELQSRLGRIQKVITRNSGLLYPRVQNP